MNKEKKFITAKIAPRGDKKIAFKVNKGEPIEVLPEQVYAAFLHMAKCYFTNAADRPDVVLSVPPYFSAVERQSVLDAAWIANVNCLWLINENTAVALNYGFFRRTEFSENEARNVAFVDFGHGKVTATIASFTQKKVKIISHASDWNIGARNFDYSMMNVFADEFAEKYGCDPRESPKARLRMLDTIEKARKILSANSEASVSVECLMEDEDLYRVIKWDEFIELISNDLEQLKGVLVQAMNESGLTANDIHSVEMIGEGSRIPAVIELSQEVFGQERGSRTLNSAEACARGCSLMAAMILPHFHVASFQIEECNPYPVDVSWSLLDNSMKTKTLFPGKSNYPSVKSMTFDKRKEPMQVAVSYNQPELLVEGIPHFLSRYQIDVPEPKHEKFGLKLRVKVDQNCIPGLDTAELVEEYQEEKKIPVKAAPPPKTEKKEGEEDAKEEK